MRPQLWSVCRRQNKIQPVFIICTSFQQCTVLSLQNEAFDDIVTKEGFGAGTLGKLLTLNIAVYEFNLHMLRVIFVTFVQKWYYVSF